MGILAVSQFLSLRIFQAEDPLVGQVLAEIAVNGRIVIRGGAENFHAERGPRFRRDGSGGFQFIRHPVVVRRIGHHRDVAIIFCRATEHRGSADVNVLDGLLDGDVRFGDGLLEGIQIDHHQVNQLDGIIRHVLHVIGIVPQRQERTVYFGMQGLHPAVHHLREARQIGDGAHLHTRLRQRPRGAPGGDDLHTEELQFFGKFNHAVLVRYTDQGSLNVRQRPPPSFLCIL